MTGNVLVYIFVALFFLFLVESIYFLKKKLRVGPAETTNGESKQNRGKLILIAGLAIVILFSASFVYLSLVKQQTPPSSTISQRATATPFPTQPEVSPTQKITPAKTTILTKTPTPTNIPPIGNADSASPTPSQLSQSAEVIVPKLPVAGSAGQTLILAFIAIFSILVGLIL